MNNVSIKGKDWILKNYNEEKVNFFKENFNLSEILSKLIAIRNLQPKEVQLFLNPKIKNLLPDPFILKDMDKCVKRTVQAINYNEKIGIFGDYDVDGASSTALLANYFNDLEKKTNIYIPDRKLEGFGPSKSGFKKLTQNGSNLIFTVDCGTLSFDTIDYYQKKKY